MLGQDELTKAIIEGQKAADSCGHFCRLGATLDDGRYICHHNGVGARDTDQQIVHANPTLTMNTEQLSAHLAAWIKGLHGHGERRDLNAAMSDVRAAGGPVTVGMPYLVGESGPQIFYAPSTGVIVPNKRLATPDVAPLSVRINADTTALDRGLAEANQRVLDLGASFGVAAGIAPNLDLRESVRLIEGMRLAMAAAVAAAKDFEELL